MVYHSQSNIKKTIILMIPQNYRFQDK